MANGYDVVNYEIWDLISGNMFYYTTNFSEIVELVVDNPEYAKDWGVLAEIILIDGEHIQIRINLEKV